MADYDIKKAFRRIELELIESMIHNLKRHRAEEDEKGFKWSQWQVEQLAALELYKKRNSKKYGTVFADINSRIESLIKIQRDAGSAEQEIAILEALKQGAKLRKSKDVLTTDFFQINDRKLEALIKATLSDMEKAEIAILRMVNDKYRKIIFDAQMYANSGAGTYEKAVDMATKDFLEAGINCVEYSNGARHTLADYADMALRTAGKRAYLQGEGEMRQQWGLSLVILNKRGNPCSKCLPFCGKVLIDDVWSGGKPEDGNYPLMSYAIEQGLYHPRCKDSHTTYFKGISTADDTWTQEELRNIGLDAKKEAKMQYARRQVEKFGRLAEYSLDEDNKKEYSKKFNFWKNIQRRWDILSEHEPLKFSQLESIHKDAMANMLGQSDERIQAITLKYLDDICFINVNAKGGAVSTARGIRVNLLSDAHDARGHYRATFHEMGHAIDRSAGRPSEKSGKFKQALFNDFENVVNAYKVQYNIDTAEVYKKMSAALKESEYHAISDIVGGLTQNKCVGDYSHKVKYWENPFALEREAFAHFYEAFARNDAIKTNAMQEMFPTATQEFFNLLED